jgi:MFS family permease
LKKPGRGVYYGWIIVGILALSMMLAYATRSSFSVFYVAILDEFGWTRAETAGIFSVSLIVYGVGGILAGYLLDRLGPRKLFPMAATLIALGALWCSRATTIWEFYIAFGLIIGFGQCSLGYVPTMTVVNHWFIRYRGLAAGIALFGLSLSFLLSPLTQYLRETVGWRTAFMIFGAAVFFVVVPLTSIFMRHRPQTMGLLPDGVREMPENEDKSASKHDISVVDPKWASTDWTLARAFKTYRLWILLGVAFMMGIMVNFPQVHQVAYITDIGYSPMLAVTTFTVFGLLNGIGPLGGLISDRIGRERCATLGAVSIAASMVAALLIRSPGMEWAWYISSICYGFGIGVLAPTLPSTYGDLFAGKNLGSIIGFINMGFGIGGAVGPYIAGYIYDVGGSYTAAFIMVLAVALIQATLMWLASPRKVRLVAGRTSSRS